MKYCSFIIESEEQDSNIEEEIKEIVYQYLLTRNISGKCIFIDYTFLSFYCNKENRVLKQIRQEHIIYIEKDDHKVILHTQVGCFEFYSSLKILEKQLNPNLFYRVHQGYIVNINEIKMVYTSELSLLSCDKIIPISRRNRKKINNLFNEKDKTS